MGGFVLLSIQETMIADDCRGLQKIAHGCRWLQTISHDCTRLHDLQMIADSFR